MKISYQSKYRIAVLAGLIVLVLAALFSQVLFSSSGTQPATTSTNTEITATNTAPVVSVLPAGEAIAAGTITVSGEVQSRQRANVSTQAAGVIQHVPVEVGDQVGRGDIMVAFANATQRASVRQAEANVQSQQARLDELRSGARPLELENAQLQVARAAANLQEATQQLFNTDLQAYVAAGDEAVRSGTLQSPTISGSYQGDQSGEYRIQLYKSGAKSGYSFRYSGLESGAGSVSTETSRPLGSRGLYIQFPDNFAKNQLLEWVVPVPNTRSNQYVAAKNRQEQAAAQLAEARNNADLATAGARQEQIAAAEAQLAAAEASLNQAQARLEETIVRAPFSGTVLSVSAQPGEYAGIGQEMIRLVGNQQLEVRAFLSTEQAASVTVGDPVRVGESLSGQVTAVAPAVNADTGNVEVRVAVDATPELLPGSYVDLTFLRAGERAVTDSLPQLPLSAVGTTAEGGYVLVVGDDNRLERVLVETGVVSDSQVQITRGYPVGERIVRRIAGLSAGQEVQISNTNNGQ